MGKGASGETYGCARVLPWLFVCVCRRLSITDTSLFLTMQFLLSQSLAARLPSLSNPLRPTLAVTHHHQLDVWEFITPLDGVLGDVFWPGVLVGVCLSRSACRKAIFMIAHAILSVRSACLSQGDRLCCSVQACECQLMEAILCTLSAVRQKTLWRVLWPEAFALFHGCPWFRYFLGCGGKWLFNHSFFENVKIKNVFYEGCVNGWLG